jgi:hypothetical protein
MLFNMHKGKCCLFMHSSVSGFVISFGVLFLNWSQIKLRASLVAKQQKAVPFLLYPKPVIPNPRIAERSFCEVSVRGN